MKVVIKKPGESMAVIEVSGLQEINKLVGNVDENGEGYSFTGSDFRQGVFPGIDIHINGSSLFNPELEENFWDIYGNKLYCGDVVFAGYHPDPAEYGVCSLTDEQIRYLTENIRSVFDIF